MIDKIIEFSKHRVLAVNRTIGFYSKGKIAIIAFSICQIVGCSSEKETSGNTEKFPVIHPVVMDTVFSKEYVAEIQSIQNVELRARIKGFIEKIHVDEGQAVQAGQILFSISSHEFKEELLRANALLKSAVAESKVAEVELKRTKTLVEKNIVSSTELEMSEAKLEAIKAKIDEATSAVSSAHLNLSFAQVKSPFNGTINRIPNKTGSLIEEGTLLTAISNNKEVFAYFYVSEKEYLEFIKQNDARNKEVSLLMADDQLHKYKGTIETTESEIDKNTGTIGFRARFSNPEQLLKHGSTGKVILSNELKDAMIVPQKSTFEVQENTYVYVVDKDNVVHMRSIVPKIRMSNIYVLESGLSVDDKVVYEGIQRIKEGDKVNPDIVQFRTAAIAHVIKL
jgi:RND family efflux transporter MFP subunit